MSQPHQGDTLQLVAGELTAIGQRLSYLGSVLQTEAVTRPQAAPAQPQAEQPAAVGAEQPPTPAEPVQAAPQPVAEPRRRIRANLEPSQVLAWVGGGVTLLGVVFLLVLAVQQDWIGPAARIAGGAALAALLIAAGWWVHRKAAEQRVASISLATTGFAALFLDVVAATALYGFLPAPAGLGLGLVVAIGGLALADRWQAQPLAVGVVLGSAICAPMITQGADALLIGFVVLLQVAAAPVQVRRGWGGLALAAGIPSVLAALIGAFWGLAYPNPVLVPTILAAAVLGVIIAAVTAGFRPAAERTAIGLLVAAPTPSFLAGPMLLERAEATATGVGMALLLAAIWAVGRYLPAFADWLPGRFLAAVGAMAVVATGQATITALDASSWATGLLCEALLLTVAGHLLRRGGILLGAGCYAVFGFFLALGNEVPLGALLWFDEGTGVAGLIAGLLITVVAVALPTAGVRIGKVGSLPASLPLWASAALALLYGTASATMAACLLVGESRGAFLTGHILITLCWVVFAIALLLRGVQVRHLRIGGLVLTAVSLAKLLLFDLATLDGFARVIAFLCAGLILLAAGVGYAKLLTRQAEPSA
ncbi:DUF2339 domain-containing protein [Saccharopolyspora dendranthemae]|uniref:Putative membrane protein DUF2339 n=1 Tax=Saccharopolyspora dendranthemae TaxID=1181886 RepID=A0A561U0F0_9PSEU|nr:DUF2339 domain-containing protein [Saccharopolyspora dendranthemae]TWF92821.1 putative membrane protein DUF2339 [Saccharopolyspora dendranthemae]